MRARRSSSRESCYIDEPARAGLTRRDCGRLLCAPGRRRSAVELDGEVVRGDVHALVQVEAMGIEAVDAAVEVEFGAALPPGLVEEPVE